MFNSHGLAEFVFAEIKRRSEDVRRITSGFFFFRQIKGSRGAEYSSIKYTKPDNVLERDAEAVEIILGDREGFSAVSQEDKLFILSGRIDGVCLNCVSRLFESENEIKLV